MTVDILLLGSSSALIGLSLYATWINEKLYRDIGTRFFKYTTSFFFYISIWSSAFFIQAILGDQRFVLEVMISQYLLIPFGYLALAFMIAAMENVKDNKRSILTNISFLMAGGLIVGLYHPESFQIVWTGTSWLSSFSFLFEIIRGILFFVSILSAVPLALRIFYRLRVSAQEDISTRILFWIIVTCLPTILLLQPFRQAISVDLGLILNQSVFLSVIALFFVLLIILFQKHPTILFMATHVIEELYIIERNGGLPLYHYNFASHHQNNETEILSAFFTGIRHYVKHSLGSGEIERILVGNLELSVCEGIFTYGILIAKESTDLTKNLLAMILNRFEQSYGFTAEDTVQPSKYTEFDTVVAKYFEFAMPQNFR
ncbi:MAG: hypothetical protein ACFFEF_01410 [Candidatus Thorarchaeota archaeon]